MDATPPRVTLIEIDDLFRRYNHRIPLQQEDRVAMLHGRNGVGKTVTLSLVAALFQGNYAKLTKFPFKTLRLELSDGSYIQASPSEPSEREEVDATVESPDRRAKATLQGKASKAALTLEYSLAGSDKKIHTIPLDSLTAGSERSPLPWIERIGEDVWLDRQSGNMLSAEEIELLYGRSIKRAGEPKNLSELRKQVPVHFIEAQRLFKISSIRARQFDQRSPPVMSTVQDVAREMAERIKETDSVYRSTSTRLDNGLPARLFGAAPGAMAMPEDELNQRTQALEAERRRLHEIGLIADTTAFSPSSLNETQRAMFAVYLKDNEEKLAVFRKLADRALILLEILNRKFAPKQAKLDKDTGYKVFSHDGRVLELDQLSSGEQHELVLLHDLLFRVEPGALLLIDEPELSLHVTWQNEFLSELITIAKTVGFDALVATHSPYIVGSRRDLMVRLGEPV